MVREHTIARAGIRPIVGATIGLWALLVGWGAAVGGERWWLVSPDEYALLQAEAAAAGGYALSGDPPAARKPKDGAAAGAPGKVSCQAVAGPPQIEVLVPQEGVVAIPPLRIEVLFCAESGVSVVADSLRIYYKLGFVTKDLTDRVRQRATVTAAGIRAENVALPGGSHRIEIQVKDTRGREGKQEFLFDVREKA